MRLLFLLLLMTSSPRVSSSFVKPDSPEMKGVVSSIILSSLEQAVIFLEKDYTNTEVNDMVSLRILQVELKAVQKIWIKDPLFRILNQKVEKLIEKLDKFIGKSINKLKLLQPTYVQAFHPLLKPGFWQLPCQWIRTNTSMIYDEIHHEDAKVLDVRDNCIVELLASRINEDWSCSCSHSCETLVTKLGASNYYLSYQLRYFLFSKMLECSGDLFQRNKHYMDLFCANMMKMNQDAELNGYTFPDHGLFMTNIMYCGFAGYIDFYKMQWLQEIFSWQIPREGSFGKPYDCSVYHTSAAVGAMGGFLYVLAKHPKELEKLVNSSSD